MMMLSHLQGSPVFVGFESKDFIVATSHQHYCRLPNWTVVCIPGYPQASKLESRTRNKDKNELILQVCFCGNYGLEPKLHILILSANRSRIRYVCLILSCTVGWITSVTCKLYVCIYFKWSSSLMWSLRQLRLYNRTKYMTYTVSYSTSFQYCQ